MKKWIVFVLLFIPVLVFAKQIVNINYLSPYTQTEKKLAKQLLTTAFTKTTFVEVEEPVNGRITVIFQKYRHPKDPKDVYVLDIVYKISNRYIILLTWGDTDINFLCFKLGFVPCVRTFFENVDGVRWFVYHKTIPGTYYIVIPEVDAPSNVYNVILKNSSFVTSMYNSKGFKRVYNVDKAQFLIQYSVFYLSNKKFGKQLAFKLFTGVAWVINYVGTDMVCCAESVGEYFNLNKSLFCIKSNGSIMVYDRVVEQK